MEVKHKKPAKVFHCAACGGTSTGFKKGEHPFCRHCAAQKKGGK